ncbi:MAG: hemolysin family protein [Proteobacteria bacterium]|nr:hemolysin family protein [Pseudomonadota bacterium]
MTLLLLYLALALGFSFLCSLLEAVILSVQPAYVAALRDEQPAVAELLEGLRNDIDRPLAAILILNTIAHTVGAAGVGAQAGVVFGSGALAIASAILTFLILVFSEIIPKTLGANYWRTLAPISARILVWLIFALYPLVVLSRALSALLTRDEQEPTVSRAELKGLVDVVASEGITDETESRVMRNLLRFQSLAARDIMTPRNVLVAFPRDSTVAEAIADARASAFSRYPIFAGTIDEITGYVLKDDLLLWAARDRTDVQLSELSRELLTMPEQASLSALLDAMLHGKEHIVLLHEDLGGTAGIATLEDVVETLLGLEIVDETDQTVDMRQLARERWEQRARQRADRASPATEK